MPDDPNPVTAEELAATLLEYAGKSDGTVSGEKRRLVSQARLTLDRLNDRRMTDPQRHAISRLESAAESIGYAASEAVDEAIAELTGTEASSAGRQAVLDLIQRLDDDGHVDLIAGSTPLEDALRRARAEAQR